MSEGYDYITVTDEEGNEYALEHLDSLEHNDVTYMAFATAETADEDEVEVVVFRVVEEDGEEVFESIEEEDLLSEVYALFMERLEQADEDEASDDND